jgi:hypothetical protein
MVLRLARFADDLYRGAGVHGLLEGGQGGHRRVEAHPVAEREVLDGRRVGVVGLYLRVVHDELVVSRDVERAVQVELVGARATHPDPLAIAVGLQVGDVGVVFVHSHGRRRVAVGRAEVEDLRPLGGDGHRAYAEVPPSVPAARGDDIPARGQPLHLDAHSLGDLLRHVDVEALEFALVVLKGLRRVGRVGRNPDCAPVFDLLQKVSASTPAATPTGGDHH